MQNDNVLKEQLINKYYEFLESQQFREADSIDNFEFSRTTGFCELLFNASIGILSVVGLALVLSKDIYKNLLFPFNFSIPIVSSLYIIIIAIALYIRNLIIKRNILISTKRYNLAPLLQGRLAEKLNHYSKLSYLQLREEFNEDIIDYQKVQLDEIARLRDFKFIRVTIKLISVLFFINLFILLAFIIYISLLR